MAQEWGQGRNQKVSGKKWKRMHDKSNLMRNSEGSPNREVHTEAGLPKKDRNISNKQPTPTPTTTWGTTTKTAQSK